MNPRNFVDFDSAAETLSNFFPTINSLNWFWRTNKDELLNNGIVVYHMGRKLIDVDRLAAFTLEKARIKAQGLISREISTSAHPA